MLLNVTVNLTLSSEPKLLSLTCVCVYVSHPDFQPMLILYMYVGSEVRYFEIFTNISVSRAGIFLSKCVSFSLQIGAEMC